MRIPTLVGVMALVACNPAPSVTETAVHERAAFLSVGGTGPDDVWVVGAQPGALESPVVLHLEDGSWTEVETGQLHAMWWVHAFDDGPAFIGGGGATVLKVDGDVVERTPTPKFFGNTVYGLWGADADQVWAVGGFAGRDGFVWRYDGSAWESIRLPDDLPRTSGGEIPAMFKVWGTSRDDVWFVGGLGTILHWDGTALELVPSGTTEQLFTVTGTSEDVVIVGGSTTGVVLRGGLDGFENVAPLGAPLLQGVTVDAKGVTYIAGADGYAARQARPGADWKTLDLDVGTPQSIQARWADGDGGLWGAGGGVLSPSLDEGVVCAPVDTTAWAPEPEPVDVVAECPAEAIDRTPDGTMARRWVEQALDSIRRDFPHPPVHARNLHHLSVAMFDAWAAYEADVDGYVTSESVTSTDVATDRDTTIAYAALRLLQHRFTDAIGGETSLDCYVEFMAVLGLDPEDTHTDGDDAIAVGNRIGQAVVDRFANDGANEANGYEDTTDWTPSNSVMVIDRPGTNVEDPDIWQQLNLGTAETQNGIVLDDSVQPYVGPQWREVEPFAIERDPATGLYADIGDGYISVNDVDMGAWVLEVLAKTSELTIDDDVTIDIGPGARGNNTLGTNDGTGHTVNPATGKPYAPNVVKRGDFARVVAEMWADGPTSETPPGHWVKLAQEVSDDMDQDALIPWGEGEPVDRLTWDIGFTMSVGAAVHDAAISAWELKRDSLGPRPVTLIRWMAEKGQRTDPALPSYDPDGLPLQDGLVELITEESAAPGERHEHLRWHIGEVAVWSWPGEPGDRKNDYTPLQWMRAKDWIPYQRRTFVTPAFPGFVSGHSTFSRSAAVVMDAYTGSPYFPGGYGEFVAPQNGYLKFESGPSEELRIQWATYYDAADEAGQSRLWGGIHVWPDDWVGRVAGDNAGAQVVQKARALTQGKL